MTRVSIPIVAASGCGSRSAQSACASGSCSSCAPAADDPVARLQSEGWILRTTIGEPRLSEVADNYRAMGYEVHVELFAEAAGSACTTCFDAADRSQPSQAWGSVYVRQDRSAARQDEDLF